VLPQSFFLRHARDAPPKPRNLHTASRSPAAAPSAGGDAIPAAAETKPSAESGKSGAGGRPGPSQRGPPTAGPLTPGLPPALPPCSRGWAIATRQLAAVRGAPGGVRGGALGLGPAPPRPLAPRRPHLVVLQCLPFAAAIGSPAPT